MKGHFYGSITGNRGESTRLGSKDSGIRTFAQGWGARVSVTMYASEKADADLATIAIGQHGGGSTVLLADDLNVDAIVKHVSDPVVATHLADATEALHHASEAAEKAQKRDDDLVALGNMKARR